jgi:hypothetical protein
MNRVRGAVTVKRPHLQIPFSLSRTVAVPVQISATLNERDIRRDLG